MDLKKLFVYVPSASEDAFIANVIKKPAEAAKYANKIVFLEKTRRIWAKGQYYGSDPADVAAVWTALGIEAGTVPSGNYTVGKQTFSYSNFAEWIGALKSYSDAKIAAEKAEVVASYQDADSAIITAYQKADADLTNAYTAFKDKVGNIDGLTGTLLAYINEHDASARTEVKVSGSGLGIQKTQGTNGHDIYTITADQSIWEFCGTAEATTFSDISYVNAALDDKYGKGENKKRLHAEVGDVWAVTSSDRGTTVLYACSEHTDGDPDNPDTNPDTNVWVAIGAAEGIVDVNTLKNHGVALTKGGGVVGVSVTPGAIVENDGSVITGGTAYTAIKAAQDNACAYTSSVGKDIITGYRAEVSDLRQEVNNRFIGVSYNINQHYELAYAYTAKRVEELDASYAYSYSIGDNTLYSYEVVQENGYITSAYVTFNGNVMFNYVTDNIWETYGA